MRFTGNSLGLLAFLVAGVSAEIHRVEVGESGLKFTPDSIEAKEGDIVEFHFDAMHSVVAGDFSNPCTPVSSGGFYSGTLPSGGDSFFSITINNTDPIFFYCAVDSHCQGGMSGVINEGSDTLASYKTASEKAGNSVSPDAPFGGTKSNTAETASASISIESTAKTSGASATTKASGTETATTTAASASTSESAAASASTVAAAEHLTGPIAGITCLFLVIGGMFAL